MIHIGGPKGILLATILWLVLNMDLQMIYKYLPSKYANLLSDAGSIKIGTLYSYRKVEEFGSEIGDSNEGVVSEYSHDEVAKRGDQLNPLEEEVIKVGPGMVVENNYIEIYHNSPDFYIFCASSSYDKSILGKLNQDYPNYEYDACVEITDLKSFVKEITLAFSGQVKFVGCFNCTYIGRKHHYTKKIPHPAIIKDPKYSYQREVRLIWEPREKNKKIEPLTFTIDRIKTNCRLCI